MTKKDRDFKLKNFQDFIKEEVLMKKIMKKKKI